MGRTKLLLLIGSLIVLLGMAQSVGNPGCSGHLRHDKTITVNGKTIYAQIAISDAERAKGLSGISCIAKNEGMIFEYDQAGYYQFWMKDMKFPLDIVWLNADKKVVTEFPRTNPSTYPNTFAPYRPAKYVLELPAGQADSLRLSLGETASF